MLRLGRGEENYNFNVYFLSDQLWREQMKKESSSKNDRSPSSQELDG